MGGAVVTVLDVVRRAADFLERKGIESPRLNAEHLLAHVLGTTRMSLYLEFDRPLDEAVRAPMRELTRARGEGRPLQHLLGTVEFHGHRFRCDARALIPRPETEQLVELLLERLPAGSLDLLDVGTGSGVIAISLALARPDCSVRATDLSPTALSLARENADALRAPVAFEQADLLDGEPCDAIVANLPYVPAPEIPGLAREVLHDPREALDGGPDGLELIRRLIARAPGHLRPGGLLALEFGLGQEAAVAKLLASHGFSAIEILQDYARIPRFAFARHG